MNLELPRDTLLHKRDKHSYGPYLTLSFVNLVKSGKSGILLDSGTLNCWGKSHLIRQPGHPGGPQGVRVDVRLSADAGTTCQPCSSTPMSSSSHSWSPFSFFLNFTYKIFLYVKVEILTGETSFERYRINVKRLCWHDSGLFSGLIFPQNF